MSTEPPQGHDNMSAASSTDHGNIFAEPLKDHDNMPADLSKDHNNQPGQGYLEELVHRLSLGETQEWVPQFWDPPEDPDKPGLPYFPGFTAKIHRHRIAGTEPRPHLSEEYLESVTQSESVVANPPNEPSSPTSGDAETAQLTIIAPIVTGEARNAQIVACTITPYQKDRVKKSKPYQATAKIYDPLYYNFCWDLATKPRDTVYFADEDYRTETAAYEHLREFGQSGVSAPEYYGSWAFALPITIKGKPQTRNVRLILIESFGGISIEATRRWNIDEYKDSFHYPEEYRLEVLARDIQCYDMQRRTGLYQNDLAGRNVMLVANSDPETMCGLAMPRVVIIDYNVAGIVRPPPGQDKLPPENPFGVGSDLYFWQEFPGWVPNEWEDGKLQDEWLLRRFPPHDKQHPDRPVPEVLPEQSKQLESEAPTVQSSDSDHEDPSDPPRVDAEPSGPYRPSTGCSSMV